jgi:hypothetical protein
MGILAAELMKILQLVNRGKIINAKYANFGNQCGVCF